MRTAATAALAATMVIVAAPAGADTPIRPQYLTQAYNASGLALFKQLSAGSGNIVLSPYSIGSAMAMALAGARGETEREMAKVLQHGLQRPQIDAVNATTLAILNGYDKSSIAPSCLPGLTLNGGALRGEARRSGHV